MSRFFLLYASRFRNIHLLFLVLVTLLMLVKFLELNPNILFYDSAPSRPVCQTDPKQVTTYVGTNKTINCVVRGDPAPEVRWETEDGSPLDNNIRVRKIEKLTPLTKI